MRVAVIGARGQLGSELMQRLPDDAIGLTHEEIEITDHDSVDRSLSKIGPDLVINTAAYNFVDRAEEVFARADMIVKVKEPQPAEAAMLREGQVLFTYLHLAADRDQTRDLMKSGVTAIAYETVTGADGGFEIKNIPAGDWQFQVWHEQAGYVREVAIGGKDVEWSRGRVDVSVKEAGTVDLGTVTVPAGLFED